MGDALSTASVARMSEAIRAAAELAEAACRFVHPGYVAEAAHRHEKEKGETADAVPPPISMVPREPQPSKA